MKGKFQRLGARGDAFVRETERAFKVCLRGWVGRAWRLRLDPDFLAAERETHQASMRQNHDLPSQNEQESVLTSRIG